MSIGFSSKKVSNVKVNLVRKKILLSLCMVVPAGFLFKFYSGVGSAWFNNYGAGLLYEVFWILIVYFFLPDRKNINIIAISVFGLTAALEILQLWHPLFLEKIRSGFLGQALIGTTFVWLDFPHYFIGCLTGWFWIRKISE